MSLLDELQTNRQDTTYFAFRVPIKAHRTMKAILARRGISCQAFFLRVMEDLFVEEERLLQRSVGAPQKDQTR